MKYVFNFKGLNMAIIGWMSCLIIVLAMSALAVIFLYNNGGEFTIGGAVNSMKTRISTYGFIVFVGYCWYLLIQHAPFKVILSI